MDKKRKKPFPGYRFLFNLFGSGMVGGSVYGLVDMASGSRIPEPEWFMWLWMVVWFVVGFTFIYYARILATAELTTKHWKMGWMLIPLGMLTGYGMIFVFMGLIWGDDDVKAHFEPDPTLQE